ncbi:uncharacterized protein LAESUDRAFT_156474 [Laetiporus sulphureus 93-53]|uniref:Uncharacterized protein n=1 Tax=Laetiporus sulphureus 93-53 TaxID=1314785 RepID=A0A165HLE0_9APHY|nr:uncharacterized protein LAESUDRAFT_156474 [Laetiporus sulphureus 93-53]KZT11882.1 hypothetical protein LAESUDRAFT_156474 [Laetiporus sulphureus 93-53]
MVTVLKFPLRLFAFQIYAAARVRSLAMTSSAPTLLEIRRPESLRGFRYSLNPSRSHLWPLLCRRLIASLACLVLSRSL